MRVCKRCSSLYPSGTRFCGIDGQELVSFAEEPLIGTTVGRYKVTQLIGRGGCGSVYKAVHTELGSEFALKVLYGNLGADQRYVERFRREAQVVSKIRSPWVVSVVDFGSTDSGLTYLVMEYCDGVGLDQVIQKSEALDPARAARFTAQIASALAVAHKLGLVHRDVKPANVMVHIQDGKEFAKLLDFGIVRMPEAENSDKLTQEGVVMGTPPYMSPEQASGGEVTASADLYSLGVVLYQMLAGRKPFTGSTVEIFDKHRTQPPPPLPVKGPIADLCFALLAKDPAARPATAADVQARAKKIEIDLRGGMSSMGDMSIDPAIGIAPRLVEPTPSALRIPLTPAGQLRAISAAHAAGPQVQSPEQGTLATAATPSGVPVPAFAPVQQPDMSGLPPLTQVQAPHAEVGFTDASPVHSPAAGQRPLLLLAGALTIVLAVLVVVLVTTKDEAVARAPATSRPAPAPAVDTAALERKLDEVLADRGLAREHLASLGPTQDHYRLWNAQREIGAVEAGTTLTKLVESARTAPIPERLLVERLDKLDPKIAQLADRVPTAEFEATKGEYLDLYRQIQRATNDAEREVMAQAIARFEQKLAKL